MFLVFFLINLLFFDDGCETNCLSEIIKILLNR